MTIGERLKIVRGDLLQEELATKLGVHKNTLANYERGGRQPDAQYLNDLLQLYPDISPSWLLTGEGPMRRGELSERKEVAVAEVGEGYVKVPRYEIAASAGGGAIVHSEQIVDFMTFRADWLRVSLGLLPSQAAVISVIGDSMEPYLADGDLVLIDMSVARIENDSIYVLQAGDSLLIKRIQKKLDGTVIVTSDNTRYQPEIFQGDLAERLRVVGRLVRRLVR